MPCLKILTNIAKDAIPADFVTKIIPVLSEVVKKDQDRFICVVEGGCTLSFRGDTTSPAAVGTLESIGNLGPEHNNRIIKGLSTFVESELNIKPNRFFLTFHDLEKYNVGISGSTVETP